VRSYYKKVTMSCVYIGVRHNSKKMRIHIIIAILYSLSSYSQTDTQFNPGKIYEIYGRITDKTNKDTLHLVNLEFMDKDYKRIKATRSDFDGMYAISFCSNKLTSDTLLIKTTKAYYKQQLFYYKIDSDSIINISMTLDKNKTYSKEELEEVDKGIGYYGCGLSEDYLVDEMEYQINKKTYRHYCSGEEKKYRNLIDDDEDMSKWILIEK